MGANLPGDDAKRATQDNNNGPLPRLSTEAETPRGPVRLARTLTGDDLGSTAPNPAAPPALRTSAAIAFVLVAWALGPALGLLLGCFWDWSPNNGFYQAAAALPPLLGLAYFVEIAVVVGPDASDRRKGMAATTVIASAGLLISAETFALVALALHLSTTFLMVAIIFPMLIQFILLADTALIRIDQNRLRL